jgi:hypothetical protein
VVKADVVARSVRFLIDVPLSFSFFFLRQVRFRGCGKTINVGLKSSTSSREGEGKREGKQKKKR